jgi:hypothetical protein
MMSWASARRWALWVTVLAGVVLVIGLALMAFSNAQNRGYRDGYDVGYRLGLQDGWAQGREEGRALQEGDSVPAGSRQPVQDAFRSGYAAGANDVFAGYDGGWVLGQPYIVTLARAPSPVAYRIQARRPMQSGIDYFACPSEQGTCTSARASR